MLGVRSLRYKVGIPLLVLLGTGGGTVAWMAHLSLRRTLSERVTQRAADVASTVAFALEASRSVSSLQRLVSSIGAQRDVEMIVVVLGDPAHVAASTRVEWLGRPLSDLPSADVGMDLRRAINTDRPSSSFQGTGNIRDHTLPLSVLVPEIDPRREVRGAVMVHIDQTLTSAEISGNATIALWGLLGLVAVVALSFWLVTNRPLRRLAHLQALAADASSDEAAWAVLDGDDEIGLLATSIRDAQARMREARHALEVQQRAVDEHAIVAITDRRGRITYVNDRFCELSGYPREELVGRTHAILNSGTHPQGFFKEMWASIGTGKTWRGEICNRTKDGELYWVDSTIVPRRDVHGAIEGYVAIRTDITPLKAQERALAAARDQAEEASRAKTEFVASMSHEIRTPMNGVVGCAQLLESTTLTPIQRQWVETIVSSGDALLAIIDDILDFSKIEAGRMEIEWRPCDLRRLLAKAIVVLRPRAEEAGLKLELEVDHQLPEWIEMDEVRLRQMVLNLVGNAVKFTRSGSVTVRVRADGTREDPVMLVEVEDTGIGISRDALPRLFERFQQADVSTTRRFGGSGLGLAIVRKIAELMHGSVGVRSELGWGSTFWVRLPLRETAAAELDTAEDFSSVLQTSGLRVLVAEDNAVNRLVAGAMLEHLGVAARFVENGIEALREIRADRPDVVLMDCHMPQMDGFEATIEIRAREREARESPLSIVALTASVTREEKERCRQSGMDGFLAKPLRVEDLVRVLRQVQARTPPDGTG